MQPLLECSTHNLLLPRKRALSGWLSLVPDDVVEIQGPPSSGKTHLLYQFLIDCMLPVSLGGWGRAAVLCDCDLSFQAGIFFKLLTSRIRKCLPDQSESLHHAIATQSFNDLHVFRPGSSSQLAAALAHLPSHHARHFSDKALGLIAIDSISAFYWIDKCASEYVGVGHPLPWILESLEVARSKLGTVILMTNWGLNPTPGSTFYGQHLAPFLTPFADPQLPAVLPISCHINLQFMIPQSDPDSSGHTRTERVVLAPVDTSSTTVAGVIRVHSHPTRCFRLIIDEEETIRTALTMMSSPGMLNTQD